MDKQCEKCGVKRHPLQLWNGYCSDCVFAKGIDVSPYARERI